ncbi:hypothetical protein BC832DRAFT_565400 [Gaertneriomyces semiglobifer]|nr:hypothetical protein BC832DRAFT_565400 [Gaertneriomyces semiglobifer]
MQRTSNNVLTPSFDASCPPNERSFSNGVLNGALNLKNTDHHHISKAASHTFPQPA